MPELPEVETVRSGLEKLIVGGEIANIRVPYPKVIMGDAPAFIQGTLALSLIHI